MEFIPTNEYREISLQEGLNQVQLGNIDKLFSDGLEEDEYIYWNHNRAFVMKMDVLLVEHLTRH